MQHLDLNTASIEELAEVPEIGERRARVLVQRRPFHDWFEVDHLPGFTASLVEEIQEEGIYLGAQGMPIDPFAWEQEEEPR